MHKSHGRDKEHVFRVRFQSKDQKTPVEVVVRSISSSEFLGLVCLEGFVFSDHSKQVILPSEDETRKRFEKINKLYIPYHNIIFIEEFKQEETDFKTISLLKDVLPQDHN